MGERVADDTTSTVGEVNEQEQEREGNYIGKNYATNNSKENKKKKTKKRQKSYWKENERTLTKKEIRTLVAEALAVLCKIIMNNHVYSFAGKTLLQEGKGCIGDKAIGIIALLVMIWWCGKFKDKLQKVNIVNDLLKIYIDDVNGVYSSVKAGTEYVEETLKHNIEKEDKERNIPEDERTMNLIKDIANSIHPMICLLSVAYLCCIMKYFSSWVKIKWMNF